MMAESLSNSSLGRIIPLAVWAASIDIQNKHRKVLVADTEFSHVNPLVQDVVTVYS